MLEHFKNYVFTCIKTAKEIFFTIFIALDPKWVPHLSIISEALATRCSVKKVFLEISQNSQETPVPEPVF